MLEPHHCTGTLPMLHSPAAWAFKKNRACVAGVNNIATLTPVHLQALMASLPFHFLKQICKMGAMPMCPNKKKRVKVGNCCSTGPALDKTCLPKLARVHPQLRKVLPHEEIQLHNPFLVAELIHYKEEVQLHNPSLMAELRTKAQHKEEGQLHNPSLMVANLTRADI